MLKPKNVGQRLLILLLVILIVVLITAFVIFNTSINFSSPNTETDNWNTYQASWCHCSFKYPNDWEVLEKDGYFLVKPKNQPNDWSDREYYSINDSGSAARSGIQLANGRFYAYNSDSGPLYMKKANWGNMQGIARVNKDKVIELNLWANTTDPSPTSAVYYWPPNNTLVTILKSFEFARKE
jgi:hypothetical protein